VSDPAQAAIAHAIASLRDFYADNPGQAVSRDSTARARLVEGLKIAVEGPNGWAVTTDMATAVGGHDSAPSPGWLLRAAVVSCDAVVIAMQAAQEGITLTTLEAEIVSESDGRGLVGGADVPAGPLRMILDLRLAADGMGRPELEGLVERALRRSPVSEALGRVVPIDVTVSVAEPA
jgi:uncharacterized OsmC-like protein